MYPNDPRTLVEQTMASIQRIALKIASLPVEERAAALQDAHNVYADAMHDLGENDAAAAEWVETVMGAIRTLVDRIDEDRGR
ncbi:hypothetical protein [Hyphomicrobium sulfonivorans]|uniref:Uncharacterized protein n=1 Tax=Hyphomicrobium sulfonivorans TaxID=121290 RepID=A0A125NW07_HYPSL|nr:hypothetical protein [Hyphomicrobium sulfonivorans]KWT71293.1 hypothetical protein APY04_0544 [Hyphomicrobium sulfonivorans]MBI1649325.1 hypothetical protein [Hyphomicrobium sulfonivorans]